MSTDRRRKSKGFLYTKEIVVWTLLLAFFVGLLIYNKDRIRAFFNGESGKTAESESDMFHDDPVDQTNTAPQETDPPETEPKPQESTQEVVSALTVPAGSGPLCIYYLDVGEGDAILLLLDGQVMLIDGGDEAHAPNLCAWLKQQGIDRVDYMISTHPHKDHASGLAYVYQIASVGKLYTPVQEYAENANFTTLINSAYTQGTEVRVPVPGEAFNFGAAEVMFIGPVHYDAEEMNNNSLVMRLRYGSQSFLFMGDAEVQEEADILAAGFDVRANVLKVGHHGSNDASSEEFVQAVHPEGCIISVGENEYGHPSDAVIHRFSNLGALVYETKISGVITVITDGTTLEWNFER